jgi:myo-inositol-1(or 4)-monophosphatase
VSTPSDLLDLATMLARRAGELQLERLGDSREQVATKSTSTDMVTEVDRDLERLIVGGIRAARPDDAIVGEEGADVEGSSGHRWLIDPIDGTTNYLYGHPGFAVSIACQCDGETIVGVVNDPTHGEVFAAVHGEGATRNGEPIHCSEQNDVADALIATGFAYDPDRRRAQGEVIARIIGEIRDVRRMGAAAVDLCSVACGRVDAYYERGLNEWDLAAGELIAAEAGAVISAIDGGPPRPGSVLAAPAALASRLSDLLVAAGAAAHA